MRMGLRDLRSGENMSAKERVRGSRANGIAGRGREQEVMSNDLSQYVTTKQAADMLGEARACDDIHQPSTHSRKD